MKSMKEIYVEKDPHDMTPRELMEKGGAEVELDKWVGPYKVRSFPWIDGMRIYFNVQYFAPGQSIEKPPVWDKTVFITDNVAGRNLVRNFTDSLVNHIAGMQLPEHGEITLTA